MKPFLIATRVHSNYSQRKANNLATGKHNGRKSSKTSPLTACFFTEKSAIKQQESTPVAAR